MTWNNDLIIEAQPVPLSMDEEGVFRVGNTRVPLDTVIEAFEEGLTAEEIVQQYPSLDLSDVYSVIGYYLNHRTEIERYLRGRSVRRREIRQQNESRWDPRGIRERLLARKERLQER